MNVLYHIAWHVWHVVLPRSIAFFYNSIAVYHTGHMAKTQYEPPPLFTASTPRLYTHTHTLICMHAWGSVLKGLSLSFHKIVEIKYTEFLIQVMAAKRVPKSFAVEHFSTAVTLVLSIQFQKMF